MLRSIAAIFTTITKVLKSLDETHSQRRFLFCFLHFKKKKMMRSQSCNLMLVCIWAVIAVTSMAAEGPRVFKVGDEFGWRVPLQNDTAVYSNWASSNRFHISDSLSFVYDKDSVIEVDKWGFYHCNGSNPITAFDNGNSTFILDRPGLFYFISGSNEHCTSGQRLIVEVMHIHHHHHDDRSASMPPSMSPLSSVSPTGSTSTTPSVSAASSLIVASRLIPFAAFLLAVFCNIYLSSGSCFVS